MRALPRKTVVATAVVGVAVTGGAAWALWPSTGAGDGNAQARSAVAITVTAVTGTADLYPGYAGGDVHFSLSNDNPYPVEFTEMAAGTVVSSNPTGCPASNVTVADSTTLSLPVAGGASNVASSIPDVVTMALAAPAGCQGAIFTIPLTLSGEQSG